MVGFIKRVMRDKKLLYDLRNLNQIFFFTFAWNPDLHRGCQGGTDGQTDGQTDRHMPTDYNSCPSYKEAQLNKNACCVVSRPAFLCWMEFIWLIDIFMEDEGDLMRYVVLLVLVSPKLFSSCKIQAQLVGYAGKLFFN